MQKNQDSNNAQDDIIIKKTGNNDENDEHLTKEGTPDRRFAENRGDEIDQEKADIADVQHLTQSGKPDRRFEENRAEPPAEENQNYRHAEKGPVVKK